MTTKLDQIDYQILQTLQANAKVSNLQLAEQIGLSPASTLERVKKLENQGIITSYHAKLDPSKLSLTAHLWLQIRLHSLSATHIAMLEEAIEKLPAVIACYQVLGDADFLVQVITKDIAAYQDIVTHYLSPITAIKHMQTYVVCKPYKARGLPIETS